MSRHHLEALRWLKSHRATHPFFAISADAVTVPDDISRASVNRITGFQRRTWAFKDEAMRDRFVEIIESAQSLAHL